MSDKLIITNYEKRALTLPPVLGTGDIEEENGKVLLPGENNVTFKCWDAVKDNAGVKIWLRADLLKRTGEGAARSLKHDWQNLTVPKAAEIISNINNVEMLLEIKASVSRKGVKEACSRRIKELQDAAEKENA